MSTSRFLRAGGAHAVAAGSSRRTIALAVAAFVGLAGVFFLMFGSGGAKVAHAQGQTITAKALTAHECDSTEWHFVINQMNTEANAPTSITVEWANGASEVVPLAMFTGKVAHYVTTSNLDSTVVSATTEIYTGWTGQFNLSHGPCGPTPTPTRRCRRRRRRCRPRRPAASAAWLFNGTVDASRDNYSGSISIQANTISTDPDYNALEVSSSSTRSDATLIVKNNTFTGGYRPISISNAKLTPSNLTGNTVTGAKLMLSGRTQLPTSGC